MARYYYEAPYRIAALGAEVGDIIVVEPAHPETPLVVAGEGFDRNRLPLILDHLDNLVLLHVDTEQTDEAPVG